MDTTDVTAWGRDYSAREFTPEEFDRYERDNPGERPVQWIDRYIGYPGNRKCISHYPGMYARHWAAGRPVSLFHQIGYSDMEGGYDRGRLHASTAKADAERVGWEGESHITACMDRFYSKQGYRTLAAGDLREYMRGFRSVLGDRTGFYGFYDSMRDAIREGWASFFIQCGARSAHVPGIHAWQENNRQPLIFGTATDILELYCSPAYAFGGEIMSHEDIEQIKTQIADLKAWLVGGGTLADQAYLSGPLPEGVSPNSIFGLVRDTNHALRAVWENTGMSIGQALTDLIKRGVADVDEVALAKAQRELGITGVTVEQIRALLATVRLVPTGSESTKEN